MYWTYCHNLMMIGYQELSTITYWIHFDYCGPLQCLICMMNMGLLFMYNNDFHITLLHYPMM